MFERSILLCTVPCFFSKGFFKAVSDWQDDKARKIRTQPGQKAGISKRRIERRKDDADMVIALTVKQMTDLKGRTIQM
jgi:hypothetical protein